MPIDIKQWLGNGEKDEVFLIKDIATHGCSGAVTGIIYYWETTKFHAEHEEEIWDLLDEYAQDAGEKLMDYIAAISIMKDVGSHAQFVNALVWWAVEVRAQELVAAREAA
jgi:hypothetical protein|tara:strand:+ start:610 stop:939 length:330 start_codon:yes stop_codon:yes gene_type:complete